MGIITINSKIALPIYKQIIYSIHDGIEKGKLKHGDMIPSVNQIANKFSLARGSVFNAYNELKATGIIDSIPGKGYFISGTQVKQQQNIFLLFSTFTPYKEILYNSILKNLNSKCTVGIYFHHHNIKIFETLIREQANYYNKFIVMPEVHDKTLEILETLDERKIFLLDTGLKEYGKKFPGVYQNFEKDIFNTLNNNKKLFNKYKRILLVFPVCNKSTGIISGFKRFVKKIPKEFSVINSINTEEIKKKDVCIVIDDNDLVSLIKMSKANNWKMGKDIGVISYNETALKSVMGDGITTITTDFEEMGKSIAQMILNGNRKSIENPFIMINRQSF